MTGATETAVAVLAGLGAGAAFGAGVALQHRQAQLAPVTGKGPMRLLAHLVRQRLWLAGIALATAAYAAFPAQHRLTPGSRSAGRGLALTGTPLPGACPGNPGQSWVRCDFGQRAGDGLQRLWFGVGPGRHLHRSAVQRLALRLTSGLWGMFLIRRAGLPRGSGATTG